MELNNELDRRKPRTGIESPFLPKRPSIDDTLRPSTSEQKEEEESREQTPEAPVRPHRGFKIEKVTEIGHEDKPSISTTVLQEDDV